jgi:hypothetical protein
VALWDAEQGTCLEAKEDGPLKAAQIDGTEDKDITTKFTTDERKFTGYLLHCQGWLTAPSNCMTLQGCVGVSADGQ